MTSETGVPNRHRIKTVDYISEDHVLAITFMDRGVMHYFHVPIAVYMNMMVAVSKDIFFMKNVKRKYRYRFLKYQE
ncbi:KTSC domain-containing protein [Klebsiella variicola]|uniref:KTSC domain-containing protein n=1 Tax=Klebsiella variicola TaxID=244366 RepID=UPI0017B84E40|nr:KTSC domain-containing protein [Escherichia coli]MCQ3870967.1 KTSC domain-containing protein [Klebsiella variicola]HDK8413709.1 KTSC domain-containing protein [Klebsiella pneumoniae]